jgi:hypothetical protein
MARRPTSTGRTFSRTVEREPRHRGPEARPRQRQTRDLAEKWEKWCQFSFSERQKRTDTNSHQFFFELDWACVSWDGDFRHTPGGWEHWSFCGDRWNRIRKAERKTYLKNAYRVLLTRARQGMVIVVPAGDAADPTRDPLYYDATFQHLAEVGFKVL